MTKYFMRLDVVYYDIAEEQLRLYFRAESELKKYKEQSGTEWLLQIPKILELTDRCRQASVIGITFAAMCLEAFFFTYSSDHLGHGTAEALDKSDLPSKLLIAPRLVLGKDKGMRKIGTRL